MSCWPRATIFRLCMKTTRITSVSLLTHSQTDIVHCEPAPVIDINNTNLEIDFVADKSEESEDGTQAKPQTKEGTPPPVTYSSAAFNREKRLAYFNKKHSTVY